MALLRIGSRDPRPGKVTGASVSFRLSRLKTRALDLGLVLLVLPIVVPFLIGLALMVRLSSPGPVLLRLDCQGPDGRSFRQYRFRSVHTDARARQFRALTDPGAAPGGDPRLTAVGRMMIRSGLNRLPQVVNVLLGQMSFFGPETAQAGIRPGMSQGGFWRGA